MKEDSGEEFWLFGYGSLIWKPPPHFDKRVPGYVEGYVRRFWQASEDHRGTPEAPGRVVTLIERSFWASLNDHHTLPEDRVWGVAYRIKKEKVEEVKDYLDIREINGYSIQYAPFEPADPATPTITCLVYIGLPDNPQFMGVQEPQALANHIFRSKGPSGENKEYLYMLDHALVDLGHESGDKHIEDLAIRVREIEASPGAEAEAAVHNELRKAASGEGHGELEETERPA